MSRFSKVLVVVALAVPPALAGCGGGGGGGGDPAAVTGPVTPTTGPNQPLTVGPVWTLHVDDQGVVYDKNSSVEAYEDIGGPKAGIMGYRVRETIKDSIQLTWYELTSTDVRRHHDQMLDSNGQLASDEWYDPYLLRLDETPDHLQEGASWTMTYADTKTTSDKPTETTNKSQNWHVDAVGKAVSVPAGTFAALQVTFTDKSDGSTKTQWFVQGVGKIKEQTSAGHTEELTSYQIAQ